METEPLDTITFCSKQNFKCIMLLTSLNNINAKCVGLIIKMVRAVWVCNPFFSLLWIILAVQLYLKTLLKPIHWIILLNIVFKTLLTINFVKYYLFYYTIQVFPTCFKNVYDCPFFWTLNCGHNVLFWTPQISISYTQEVPNSSFWKHYHIRDDYIYGYIDSICSVSSRMGLSDRGCMGEDMDPSNGQPRLKFCPWALFPAWLPP